MKDLACKVGSCSRQHYLQRTCRCRRNAHQISHVKEPKRKQSNADMVVTSTKAVMYGLPCTIHAIGAKVRRHIVSVLMCLLLVVIGMTHVL